MYKKLLSVKINLGFFLLTREDINLLFTESRKVTIQSR